jgi:hypothetical protein
VGAGAGVGVCATGALGDDAPSPIRASSVPTATTLSTGIKIFSNLPAAGDGISVSTLSVETSSKGSSSAT